MDWLGAISVIGAFLAWLMKPEDLRPKVRKALIYVCLGGVAVSVVGASVERAQRFFSKEEIIKFEAIRIIDKHFKDERVSVGGKLFENCSFHNVTFIYDGGQWGCSPCSITGNRYFETNDLNATGTVDLLKGLELLEPKFSKSWKHQSKTPR